MINGVGTDCGNVGAAWGKGNTEKIRATVITNNKMNFFKLKSRIKRLDQSYQDFSF